MQFEVFEKFTSAYLHEIPIEIILLRLPGRELKIFHGIPGQLGVVVVSFFQSVLYKRFLLIHQIISDLSYECFNGVEVDRGVKINPLTYQSTCRIQIVTVRGMGRTQD